MSDLYNIALTSPSQVKDICPEVPDSVDDSLMISWIIDEQEQQILNLLGCDLYQDILGQYSGNTLSTANNYIYNRFILRILAKRVVIRTLYASSYQIENSGVRKKVSEQSDYVDREELNTLVKIYKNDVDRISKDMIYYINKNITVYPLFTTSDYCDCGSKDRQTFSSVNIMGC
jgi:hypothetical protein